MDASDQKLIAQYRNYASMHGVRFLHKLLRPEHFRDSSIHLLEFDSDTVGSIQIGCEPGIILDRNSGANGDELYELEIW